MVKLLSVIGTRPQIIKLNMIVKNLYRFPKIEHQTIYTNQHYDYELSGLLLKDLNFQSPMITLADNTSKEPARMALWNAYGELLDQYKRIKPDCVLVYGDCMSTWLAADTAYWMDIPIAHIEAGCRCGDRNMPEEKIRKLVDWISTYHFCSTEGCRDNLNGEIEYSKGIVFSGDLMYDSFLYYQKVIDELDRVCEHKNVLLTVHREEHDNKESIERIFARVGSASTIFPCHPRIIKTIKENFIKVPDNITLTNPVGYFDTLCWLRNVDRVMTDSGGLIREAYFAGVPYENLRSKTEWPELFEKEVGVGVFGDGSAAKTILETLYHGSTDQKDSISS